MMGQRVEEGIGRGIVGLARRAEQRGGGRKHDEEVEWCVESLKMQVPGARDFRTHDGFETARIEVQKNAVIEYAGRVDDAAQWSPVRWLKLDQHSSQRLRVGDVGRQRQYLSAGLLQTGEGGSVGFRLRSPATEQDELTGAA